MSRFLLFGILSLPIILVSIKSLKNTKNHGFYRFLSWECIAWIFASSYKFWFVNPTSTAQIFSWIFLVTSGYLVVVGVILLHRVGKPVENREGESLYQFEKTTELVDKGLFRYIRHPLYGSLVFLTWGIFFKNINIELFIVSILSTLLLYLTAKFDEKECIKYFGSNYIDYMKRSKMFIPYIF